MKKSVLRVFIVSKKELVKFPEIKHWIEFCKSSKRGLMGLHGVTKSEEEDPVLEEV